MLAKVSKKAPGVENYQIMQKLIQHDQQDSQQGSQWNSEAYKAKIEQRKAHVKQQKKNLGYYNDDDEEEEAVDEDKESHSSSSIHEIYSQRIIK